MSEYQTMDVAAAEVLKFASYQKPMNDVIERGDSPIQMFYQDTTVFLTGGSGFLGKQLIEKLFRSCAIKKMYLLTRAKKGKSIQERLQYMLQDPVFDLVREKKPQFAECIVPVEGDVGDLRLGLSDDTWTKLTEEVDHIFHSAARVHFESSLRDAIITNVRGTRELIALAKQCHKLKNFVYVSTAYLCATMDNLNKDIFEQFYPVPLPPDTFISIAEELDENRIDGIAKSFTTGWLNTYVFTKAVTENLIRLTADELPICIVRPPLVSAAHTEPAPGWLDVATAASTASGLIVTALLGILHVFYWPRFVGIAVTPVDYVNNAVIASGWDASGRRKAGDRNVPIYTVSDKDNFLHMSLFRTVMLENKQFSTDKAIYLADYIECTNPIIRWVLSLFFHYIPAVILDTICSITGKRPKQIKSFVDMYKKIDKIMALYEHFAANEWQFRNDNLVAMRDRMCAADRAIYNFDISCVNFRTYVRLWGLGLRKYIIKDGLNNSHKAYKKQFVFKIVNYLVLSLYASAIYCVLYFSFKTVKYLVNV